MWERSGLGEPIRTVLSVKMAARSKRSLRSQGDWSYSTGYESRLRQPRPIITPMALPPTFSRWVMSYLPHEL